jgi:hypothetical protein
MTGPSQHGENGGREPSKNEESKEEEGAVIMADQEEVVDDQSNQQKKKKKRTKVAADAPWSARMWEGTCVANLYFCRCHD